MVWALHGGMPLELFLKLSSKWSLIKRVLTYALAPDGERISI